MYISGGTIEGHTYVKAKLTEQKTVKSSLSSNRVVYYWELKSNRLVEWNSSLGVDNTN